MNLWACYSGVSHFTCTIHPKLCAQTKNWDQLSSRIMHPLTCKSCSGMVRGMWQRAQWVKSFWPVSGWASIGVQSVESSPWIRRVLMPLLFHVVHYISQWFWCFRWFQSCIRLLHYVRGQNSIKIQLWTQIMLWDFIYIYYIYVMLAVLRLNRLSHLSS